MKCVDLQQQLTEASNEKCLLQLQVNELEQKVELMHDDH
jgi:hypothetical protein